MIDMIPKTNEVFSFLVYPYYKNSLDLLQIHYTIQRDFIYDVINFTVCKLAPESRSIKMIHTYFGKIG